MKLELIIPTLNLNPPILQRVCKVYASLIFCIFLEIKEQNKSYMAFKSISLWSMLACKHNGIFVLKHFADTSLIEINICFYSKNYPSQNLNTLKCFIFSIHYLYRLWIWLLIFPNKIVQHYSVIKSSYFILIQFLQFTFDLYELMKPCKCKMHRLGPFACCVICVPFV